MPSDDLDPDLRDARKRKPSESLGGKYKYARPSLEAVRVYLGIMRKVFRSEDGYLAIPMGTVNRAGYMRTRFYAAMAIASERHEPDIHMLKRNVSVNVREDEALLVISRTENKRQLYDMVKDLGLTQKDLFDYLSEEEEELILERNRE